MVNIGPFLLISLWLTSCAIRGSIVPKCVGPSDSIQPAQTAVCKGLYYEPVCLVCGDKGSEVQWLFGETLVAQTGINFGHVDSVDICDGQLPSIGLASCYQAMTNLISCKLKNRNTNLATFKLECIGPELLISERNSLEPLEDNLTLVNPSNEINLVCDFRQVLPPVSLQWFVDGELFETKRFTKKVSQPRTYSLSLAINSSQVNRSIICTSYGNRAPNMSRSIFHSKRRQISAIRERIVPKCVGPLDSIQPVQTTVCKGLYYEPVCFVCGDKGSVVQWLFGVTLVAQRGINFGHVDIVDICDDQIPSMELLISERNSLEPLEDNLTLVNPSNEINLVCDFRQVLPPVSLQCFLAAITVVI
ncbi:uncharacterized protein [Apostichopus japonicus]|uniref:uncharacterized protein n=1 Tax=Stichopus japonicus TaxID=307972 RepID=UPI003AB4C73C